jgi:hypothetical protein
MIRTGKCVVPPSIKGEKMRRLPRRKTAGERDQEDRYRFRVPTSPQSNSTKELELAPPVLALPNCSLSQCSIIEVAT